LPGGTGNWYIGHRWDDTGGNSTVAASIDDVRIYNRVLNAAEIKQLYNLGTANAAHSNSVALSNGLVGYWPLDGSVTNWATGQTQDLSSTNDPGSLSFMSTTTSPTQGKIGQAFNFNGAPNAVVVPYSSAINPPSTLSVGAWVYHAASSGIIETVSEFSGTNDEPYYILYRGDLSPTSWEIGLKQSDDTYPVNPFTMNFPVNSWHHIMMTADGAQRRVYLDGVLVDSQSYNGTIKSDSGGKFYIGESNFTGPGIRFWNGKLDDVRIYNRALGPQEEQQLYHQGIANVAHSNIGISNGLVGYWPLDGNTTSWTTDTTQDVSGNGNTGTLVGMSTTTSPTQGKIGQALMFDGSTSYIDAGNVLNLTSAITVSAWVKPSTFSGPKFPMIVAKGENDAYTFFINNPVAPGAVFFRIGDGSGAGDAQSAAALALGKWGHVVGTYDGSTVKVYVNGVLSGSKAKSGSIPTTALDLDIGYCSDACNADLYFAGAIDDVRIYNRALNASEVKQLYNMGR
jgi:hypothetical protein